MPRPVGFGLEGCIHQPFEERRRQQGPALGQRPIGNTLASNLPHMLSQCASLGDYMKDQALNQLHSRDYRRTTPTQAAPTHQGINEMP